MCLCSQLHRRLQAGGSWSEASPRQKFKITKTKKGWGHGSSDTELAGQAGARVQTPVLQKKKKKKEKERKEKII
jgi:hypothetical protein